MHEKKSMGEMDRMSIALERVENGTIVRVSGEGGGKDRAYTSRTFIAPDGQTALRIATTHMQAMNKKAKSQKGKGKSKGKARASKE